MKNNSTIFKNPQDQYLLDLSVLGSTIHHSKTIEINQQNHHFQIGDILYYSIKNKIFAKAIAINDTESEVCGAVLDIIDNDNFVILSRGKISTDRYTFDVGTPLYLSDAHPGKLVSITPQNVIKQIATQDVDGIILDIQRGYYISSIVSPTELEPYTQEELDEIIKNIW